ncbi:metalloregulator ArsR/SmtB family transcription factor [Ekhidna sp.]|uniref:ArsR/SmtB family transcription factor n=1 Tax=Ekhidna sp. TaxID=2608089 RepID=UPI0032986E77
MSTRRDVFQAIADPTRRQIIDLLSEEPKNLNSLAEQFDISRPAISQQIKILEECGLVEITKKGRERYCSIQPSQLIPAFMWIEQYKKLWEDRIDSFESYLVKLQSEKKEK